MEETLHFNSLILELVLTLAGKLFPYQDVQDLVSPFISYLKFMSFRILPQRWIRMGQVLAMICVHKVK